MIRPAALAALAALLVSACSSGDKADTSNPTAGLDSEILAWRTAVEAEHPACASKVEGKGCQDFQVMCKAYQEIDAAEKAKGVVTQVVAAMTFAGRNPDGSTGKSGSSFMLFSKDSSGWTRTESKPVNMSSCAPLA